MTYKTKWARRCAARIRHDHITEAELFAMRKILKNAFNARGVSDLPSCTKDEAFALVDLIDTCTPRVSTEQCAKGAAHLHAIAFRKDGTQRQTLAGLEFRAQDLQIVRDLQTSPRFLLERLYIVGGGLGYTSAILPVYRAIGKTSSFSYIAPSWQAGGRFEIIGRWYP